MRGATQREVRGVQEIDGAFEESSVPCELLGTPHRALPELWPAELSRAWERRQQPGLDSRLESWESRGEPAVYSGLWF